MFLLQEEPQTALRVTQEIPVPEEQEVMVELEDQSVPRFLREVPVRAEPQVPLVRQEIPVTPVVPDAPLQCFVYRLVLAVRVVRVVRAVTWAEQEIPAMSAIVQMV